MPLACDVQEPEYLGHVGKKVIGKLTPEGIYDMGVNALKLNYIFWGVVEGSGKNFTFARDVLPYLNRVRGKINTRLPRGESEAFPEPRTRPAQVPGRTSSPLYAISPSTQHLAWRTEPFNQFSFEIDAAPGKK
jgi:hypothetical protein